LPAGESTPLSTGNKVCIFTGAGGTLGNAFCRRYLTDYRIVAVHRSAPPEVPSQHQSFQDPLQPEADLPENRHRVFSIRSDLQKEGEIGRVVELALARFDRIDLLVNAAVHSVWGSMVDDERLLASLSTQFEVNTMLPLRLAVFIAKAFWRGRKEENEAANRNVINVSSLAGSRIITGSGQSVYAASKAALNHLTSHMAAEFAAFGVRVNAVTPNSFPRLIPTDRVVDAMRDLDRGDMTGKILEVGQDSILRGVGNPAGR
jgi:NAD(P)-dependent dehydrogenase (short-subunit alcohol dehydrogenase family)